MKDWHQSNKDKRRIAAQKRRHAGAAYIRQYKQEQGCAHCSTTDFRVLTLHHIDPNSKSFAMGYGGVTKKNIGDIQAEMDKCIVLCHNCHNRLHYNMHNMTEEAFIHTYGEGIE